MSISGVSDILDAPEGLEGLDDGLAEDLIGDVEQDEDSSLLDAALGDVSAVGEGEKEETAVTPTEEPGDSVLDETNDSVQEEEDPVCTMTLINAHPELILGNIAGDRSHQGSCEGNGRRGREAQGDARRSREANDVSKIT